MRVSLLAMIALLVLVAPATATAKKLKPKYYGNCYQDYATMRDAVPKPAFDIAGSAKTVNAVAGIAGRFGGFGSGLGSIASTASTVAEHAETIADVAAFTQSIAQSFPDAGDRYAAYADRMVEEAKTMHQVADSAMASQTCYADAYAELKLAAEAGSMKSREVKKRHQEITRGVDNVMEVLNDGSQYMDTNVGAYNDAMTQETAGAGLDLDGLVSLAGQAQGIAGMVGGLSASSALTGSAVNVPSSPAGWASDYQASLAAQAQALGVTGSESALPAADTSLFGGLDSLSSLATLGGIDPAMAGNLAVQQAMGRSAMDAASADATQAAVVTPASNQQIVALMQAGADMQPYLQAYERIKILSGLQHAVAQKVSPLP